MRDYDLRLYAKGASFEDGVFDLRSMELIISNYRSITDRLIAVQLGRRQLTPSIRKQIDYQTTIKHGSIELFVEFAFSYKEIFSVLAADGGHQLAGTITKLYREAINLRKAVARALEKGFPINIKIVNNINIGSNNTIANAKNGDIIINDPKTLWAAQATKHPTDRLISGIDGTAIEYTHFSTKDDEVRLTADEKEILGQNKEELSGEVNIQGRLDMIAFSSHRGTIVSGEERFPVTWDENIRTELQKVVDLEGVNFTVRPIIDQKRLHNEAIAYHIIDCFVPQQDLDI